VQTVTSGASSQHRPRLPRGDGRQRRQRASHHHGDLHSRSHEGSDGDGAPPLDLIDGSKLCTLLKEYGPWVRIATRTVEDISIDEEFYDTGF
jgi:hypothetical protein